MLPFDAKDFTKSALSLSGGMGVMVGIVAFRTQGNLLAIVLASGLPLGVLSFWGVYLYKMKQAQEQETQRRSKEEAELRRFFAHSNSAFNSLLYQTQSYTNSSNPRARSTLNPAGHDAKDWQGLSSSQAGSYEEPSLTSSEWKQKSKGSL